MIWNAIIEEKNEFSDYAVAEIIALPREEEQGARPSFGPSSQMQKNIIK
jgi:hypothetical protein